MRRTCPTARPLALAWNTVAYKGRRPRGPDGGRHPVDRREQPYYMLEYMTNRSLRLGGLQPDFAQRAGEIWQYYAIAGPTARRNRQAALEAGSRLRDEPVAAELAGAKNELVADALRGHY